MYDLIIVGGGPAGSSAAVYAARKQLKTLFMTGEWGGQSVVSPDIQNWIGTISISGNDLAKHLREHVEHYKGPYLDIVSPTKASGMEVANESITIKTDTGDAYSAQTLFVAAGADRRKLPVPGAAEYDQKGLTYCATCDGPLFEGKDVVVIGGGNAGFETAAQLLAYVKSVTLLERTGNFKADAVTVKKVLDHPNMNAVKNTEVLEVFGDTFVKGVKYRDITSGEEYSLDVEGVFVEIGLVPNTRWLGDVVEFSEYKQIVVDPRTQRSSHERIWAAGDVTNALYHQNNIAAGDAIKAIENIYSYLRTK